MRVRTWTSRALSRVLREESGFTLIELMSAMLVTLIGVIGLITALDSSRQLIGFSESKETAVHAAQQELERLQSLAWDDLALSSLPPACAAPCDKDNPGFYVTGEWYRWDQRPWGQQCDANGVPHLNCERLVVGGQVSPALEQKTEAAPGGGVRLRLQIQRFITAVDDDCIKEPPLVAACTGTEDYRRISVVVRVEGVRGNARVQSGDAPNREGLFNEGPGRPVILSTVMRPPPEGGH